MKQTTLLDIKAQSVCRVCDKQAKQIVRVELLPNNGVKLTAIHKDGTEHSWSSYGSVEDIGRKSRRDPIFMKCPKCGEIGRIGQYRPHWNKPQDVVYFIAHPHIPGTGTWGKNKAYNKQPRHYISDVKQRTAILKKLGRYIEPTSKATRS